MDGFPRRGTPRVTNEQLNEFLHHLRRSNNVSGSARLAGFDPHSARRYRDTDENFAEAWDDAVEEWRGSLMEAATLQGRDGYKEYVVSMGKIVMDPSKPGEPLFQKRYAPAVLIKLLQAEFANHRPQAVQAATVVIPADLMPDPLPTPDEPGPAVVIL